MSLYADSTKESFSSRHLFDLLFMSPIYKHFRSLSDLEVRTFKTEAMCFVSQKHPQDASFDFKEWGLAVMRAFSSSCAC